MTSATRGSADSGTLNVADDVLEYHAPHTRFRVPLTDIAVIGEYTTAAGPAVDDYFLVFLTSRGEQYEASFYAHGSEEALRAMATESPLVPRLAASADLASNILWPAEYAGQTLFTYREAPATTRVSRWWSRLGFSSIDVELSSAAQAALRSGGRVRHRPTHAALVADDDPNVVKLIAAELRKRPDWHVDAAANGEEALAKVQRTNYDVIVLDLGMPRMDGYQVLRRLRQPRYEQRKRVIIISGNRPKLQPADRRIVGGVMHKPLKLHELNAYVDQIAGTHAESAAS